MNPRIKACLWYGGIVTVHSERGEGSLIDGKSDVCSIHGEFGVILVHMVPASRTVKGAFAWETISRSRGDQIRYSNCVVQRSV